MWQGELEKWKVLRSSGRRAFLARFLRRTWLWHSVLLALLYGGGTYWFLAFTLREPRLRALGEGLAWAAGVLGVLMVGGYLVGLAIWNLNELRFRRATR